MKLFGVLSTLILLAGNGAPQSPGSVTARFRNVDVQSAIRLVAHVWPHNFVLADSATGKVSFDIQEGGQEKPWEAFLDSAGLAAEKVGAIWLVVPKAEQIRLALAKKLFKPKPGRKLTLEFSGVDFRTLFKLMSDIGKKKYFSEAQIEARPTLMIHGVPAPEIANAVAALYGFRVVERAEGFYLSPADKEKDDRVAATEIIPPPSNKNECTMASSRYSYVDFVIGGLAVKGRESMALLVDPDGKSDFVKIGRGIGKELARVTAIDAKGITVSESWMDASGVTQTRTNRLEFETQGNPGTQDVHY